MFFPRPLLLALLMVFALSAHPAAQNTTLKIADSKGDPNPVVNERGMIALSVTDSSGQPVNGVSFESGSPDIASVDPQTGAVRGVKRGFATVTARRGNESASVFVAVARVENGKGAKVPGDAKPDTGGRIYLSDPDGDVILRKKDFASKADVYAGKKEEQGRKDGNLNEALFAGPTAVSVDNARGGVYIADTLNHSIRNISFNDVVTTVIGDGSPGINTKDVTPFLEARFKSPRGVAVDIGGNLIVADTDNHAIFIADLEKHVVRLLAGKPGMSGKADGRGSNALFFRPTAIAVSNDGKTIAVADTGNNRCRLITRDGDVTTLSSSSKKSAIATSSVGVKQTSAEIAFNNPQSISFDNTGNIYVVDDSDIRIATLLSDGLRQVVSLAQTDVSFGKASSVVVQGNRVIVLDASAETEDDAIKVVTFGAPEIASLSIDGDKLEGGSELVITGKNFAPESRVLLGDKTVDDAIVESATQIRLNVPVQDAPGMRTLSIQTRGGVAQRGFGIRAKLLSELNDGEITTIAGGIPFLGDGGSASNASFSGPASAAIDGAGNIFVSDFSNNRVRRIDTTGVVTTVAGNGRKGFSGDGGPAINASLDGPTGLSLNADGDLFIADLRNNRVRRIDAKTGIITSFVGNGDGGLGGDGGPAAMASIVPIDAAVDSSGNLFIVDVSHNRIRRVDAATGIIATVAGSGPEFEGGFAGDDGPAINARLNEPLGIAIDAEGNLFISDGGNNRIRRVDAKTGIITTFAGNGFKGDFGQGGFDGDGGPAVKAKISVPVGLAMDASGNLFFADIFNLRIRRIDAKTNIISTAAGNGSFDFSGDGGPAIKASLINPEDVLADGSGNLFIADFGNDRVRRVDAATHNISTFAGIGADTFKGDGGPAVNASLRFPRSVGLDKSDNLYIADQINNRIRRVDKLTGIIATVAGGGTDFIGDGGPALKASFSNPVGVAIDDAGNIFVADRDRNAIRRVDAATGIITTFAGDFRKGGFNGDGGPADKAVLDSPASIAFDPAGNLLIIDTNNHRVRRVDRSSRVIKTIAGSGPVGGFNGSGGFAGDKKKATKARLNIPTDIAVDPAGNIFIVDLLNFRIRRIDASKGKITTVAGGGDSFDEGIPAVQAKLAFFSDSGVAADSEGNFFFSDQGNHRIRRIDAKTGIITTVIGNGALGYGGDGGKALNASLAFPNALAIDGAGNLYISDSENNAVRVVKGIAKKN